MKAYISKCILAAAAVFAAASCKPVSPEGGDDKYPETVQYKTSVNRTKVLKNPMNGWVMYLGINSDPSYLDTEYTVSSLGRNVKVRDYASCCYIRTGWSFFNPADGVYAWRDPSSNLYKLIHKAWDNGMTVAFRVVVDGRDQRANTPQFVFDAGAKYLIDNATYPDRKTPLPQDPVFRKYYEKLVTALAEDFNDPSKCAFIDGYGLGKWGEGHTVAYSSQGCAVVDANTQKTKEEVMDWITKLYASKFTAVPLIMTYHRSLGHPTTLYSADWHLSEEALQIALDNGYSLRSDAFGMTEYYGSWEKGITDKWHFKRPIVMEGGWIVSQHRYWLDPAGYREGHPEDVRKGEYEACGNAHVNMMDFRTGAETKSWFEDAFDLVQKFVNEGGYRIYPDQVNIPESVTSGSKVKISSRWRNLGWGYLPNNIPQWNYKYRVAYALVNASGEVVRSFVDPTTDPSEWYSGKAYTCDLVCTVDVPAGTYKWAVAIVDTTKDNTPGIILSLNDKTNATGWTLLGEVVVR